MNPVFKVCGFFSNKDLPSDSGRQPRTIGVLSFYSSQVSPALREVRAEAQSRNLEAGIEAETIEEHGLLANSA